jgi:uncharacterized protein YoxC
MAYTLMSLCNLQYIQQSSGVLAVFSMSISVSMWVDPKIRMDIYQGLQGIWVFAEVILFTLSGCSLNFDHENGPLYGERGPSGSFLGKIVGVMFAGMFARLIGVFFSTFFIIRRSFPEHRQSMKYCLLFALNMFIFQIPKATVQATLGSVAYNTALIPGVQGLNKAQLISQAAAFTILVFAPLGTILTKYVGEPIALMLAEADLEAHWSDQENRYLDDQEFVKTLTEQVKQLDEREKEIQDQLHNAPATVDPLAAAAEKIAQITQSIEEPVVQMVRRYSRTITNPDAADAADAHHVEPEPTNMIRRYSLKNNNQDNAAVEMVSQKKDSELNKPVNSADSNNV